MTESFEEFMKRVDAYLISTIGVCHADVTDARWHDCYEENSGVTGSDFEQGVRDTLSDADDMFAILWESLS